MPREWQAPVAGSIAKTAVLVVMGLAVGTVAGCGRYPDDDAHQDGNGHGSEARARLGRAERTGSGYSPLFLQAPYKVKDVSFEIKETAVELGGGYSYKALTFDGNFPARTLVVEQGTLVRIRLKNAGKEPHSVHTHVIKYTPANDGTDATATPPGETRYYFWEVTADTPTGFYPFHDHGGGGEGAMERGLVGMVNVVAPGGASDAGYGILLHDLDPRYLYSTSGAPIPGSGGGGGHGNHGGGGMASADVPAHLINGRFGPAAANRFKVSKGKTLRLGVVNLGTDIHTFHPHGNSFKTPEGELGDNLEVLPGGYRTVTMQGEAAGDWQYHCHVPGHPEGGMVARYVVE